MWGILPQSCGGNLNRFESWTNDNGLPQNTVRSVTQTHDGYLWLTTFDGLVRFNGVHFKVFNTNNTKGLISNRFTALYEDHDGTLWIGTNDGGLTLYRDGAFTSYTSKDGLPSDQIAHFAPDLIWSSVTQDSAVASPL